MTDKTKYIIKIIASTITILAIIGYGIFAFVKFGNYGAQNVCNKIQVKIVDDNDYKFIQPNDIITQLNECNIYPIGETISHKQTNQIEKCVEAMNLVKRAECYKKNNGDVVVSVYQRHPMFLVVNGNNGYYIDTERKKMPTSSKFTAWLPVVSGFVSEKFAKKDLYDFIVYINNDEFWSNHFGQIYINQKQEIELISKNGVYNIYLGKLSNYQDKLKKLRAWYEQYPEAAWGNKYSRVDLSYEKLIYCIKKTAL